MIIAATDGYIVDATGPFLCDSHYSDATIMKHILLADINGFLYWYDTNDVIVVDHGFRDSEKTMKRLGLNVAMPEFLNREKQMSVVHYLSQFPSETSCKQDLEILG